MKRWWISFLLLAIPLAVGCGRVTGKDDLLKESNTSGITNPNAPGGGAAGAPPAYVSHTRINPTLLEVSLTKELTDISATNTSNFIFNNACRPQAWRRKPASQRHCRSRPRHSSRSTIP